MAKKPTPGEPEGLRAMRGAIATPRNVLAAATPFEPTELGAPPQFIKIPKKISMWGNDVHGDCVTAEEAFAKACHDPEIFITDATVVDWATKHGVLDGAYIYKVIDWMQNDGFRQDGHNYCDGGRSTVDWHNQQVLNNAISIGPVKLGVAADQLLTTWRAAGGKSGWFALNYKTDTKEDHCPSLCGYGSLAWLAQQLNVPLPPKVNGQNAGYAMFTWNSIGIIDRDSMLAITYEAWLRTPTTIVR